MGTIYIFIANGFEEIEALTPVDVLRRGGLNIRTVSINEKKQVESAHGVTIECDSLFEDLSFADASMLVLPGGMPGATNLSKHEGLRKLILQFNEEHKPLAAICAAPMVYGMLGILKGKKATCYPGFEKQMEGTIYTGTQIEQDGNFITGNGPGAAMLFSFAILEYFCGKDKAHELKAVMMIK